MGAHHDLSTLASNTAWRGMSTLPPSTPHVLGTNLNSSESAGADGPPKSFRPRSRIASWIALRRECEWCTENPRVRSLDHLVGSGQQHTREWSCRDFKN